MNREIGERWVAELRSGKWKQGRTYLAGADGKHCCLGVLCRMAEAEGVVKAGPMPYGETSFEGARAYLPLSVCRWSGVETQDGHFTQVDSLSRLNDSGATFAEIAAVIEANMDTL